MMGIAHAVALAFLAALGMSAEAQGSERFAKGMTWDWQLTEPLDLGRNVDVLDLHPGLVTASDIAALKMRGVMTICYVSVGTIEKTSPDIADFPHVVVGKVYGDWPDEKFLDIRQLEILLPLMTRRFEHCKALGFDAIEPDNMDVHVNRSGFAISEADTIAYVEALAGTAHGIGLAMGQKNVPELTSRLVGTLDFVVTESCFQDGWCGDVAAYAAEGKAIFDAEYKERPLDLGKACAQASDAGISLIVKERDLTRTIETCPQ